MAIYIPSPEDLDDAVSRGAVRERIAAAEVALLQLEAVAKLLRTHRLGEDDDHNMLSDMASNLERRRDRLQEAVDVAMALSAQRAPRRADPAMVERVRA